MVKTQNKPVQKQNQTQKGSSNKKMPEVEDFFTNFLSKKVRNITKKLGHIQELEKKIKQSGEELKKDQLEMISRREELEKAVEENNAIKKIYLEAYSKRAEYEPIKKDEDCVEENKEAVVVEEDKSDKEVIVPQIDVEAIKEEAEAKGLNKACGVISKFLVSSYLLRTQDFCDQFAYISGMDNLETLNEFMSELNNATGDNVNQQVIVQKRLEDLVNCSPVMGTETKTTDFIAELVNSVVNNSNFATFVPQVKEPEVIRDIPESPELATCNMNVVNEDFKEEEEAIKTKSRRESEIQQKIFMEEDSEDEQFEAPQDEPAMKTENQMVETKIVEKPQEKQVLQEQSIANNKPVEQPKKSNEEDEDDWVEVKRGNNYYNRDNQRGGRGRGGRGNRGGFRGGRDYKGEKREYKDGEKREYKDGEKREFKDGERKERRVWTNKDGENRENRGGRGRGGRGRGRFNKDGEKRVFNKTNSDGERVDVEEQPRLKEVGTLDRGNEQPAQVHQTE